MCCLALLARTKSEKHKTQDNVTGHPTSASSCSSKFSVWVRRFTVSMEDKNIGIESSPPDVEQPTNGSAPPPIAHHEPEKSRFVVKLDNGDAVLDYVEKSPGVLELQHTRVPDNMRGQGVGQALAKEAFDHVVKNDLKMTISCTYLQKYLEDNPKEEYKKRVV